MNLIPDGYFVDDYIVFGDLGRGSVLAKGYAAQFPDLSASDDEAFRDLETDIRLMLGCLNADERLQIHFYTSSDFSEALAHFQGDTWRYSQIDICTSVRQELVTRFRDRMEDETLIHTKVRLYISFNLPKFLSKDGRKVRGFQDVFKVLRRSFEQREVFFNLLLASYGGSVRALDSLGHYDEMLRFWSPGQARVLNGKGGEIDWLRTVEDLCRFSEVAPRAEPDHGFFLDGHYFGIWLFKTMPRAT